MIDSLQRLNQIQLIFSFSVVTHVSIWNIPIWLAHSSAVVVVVTLVVTGKNNNFKRKKCISYHVSTVRILTVIKTDCHQWRHLFCAANNIVYIASWCGCTQRGCALFFFSYFVVAVAELLASFNTINLNNLKLIHALTNIHSQTHSKTWMEVLSDVNQEREEEGEWI